VTCVLANGNLTKLTSNVEALSRSIQPTFMIQAASDLAEVIESEDIRALIDGGGGSAALSSPRRIRAYLHSTLQTPTPTLRRCD
jgi:hypothetical protein